MHLRITFHFKKSYDKTKQEKGPFALAFARIMEGSTLIGDGTHELLVYKVPFLRNDCFSFHLKNNFQKVTGLFKIILYFKNIFYTFSYKNCEILK